MERLKSDIPTTEVLEWQGIHLLHFKWFMGINPRGLVPVLVDDGKIVIESNDILEYLEAKFPAPVPFG